MPPTTRPPCFLRASTRELTERAWNAALGEGADGEVRALSRTERLRVAVTAARATGHAGTTARLERLLLASETSDSPGSAASGAASGNETAWNALLEHVQRLASDPVGSEEAIRDLGRSGVEDAQVVAASQVAAFTVFRARLVVAAEALHEALTHEVDAELTPWTGNVADDLGHPRVEFPLMDWTGWVSSAADGTTTAKDDAKGASDYYGVLSHEAGFLRVRTELYDEIMTGEGSLERADREFVALATSLTTGCAFCATVHGRRHFFLSKDTVSTPRLKRHGVGALESDRERALAGLGAALATTPPTLTAGHVTALLDLRLDPAQIMDAAAVAAMFSWANRLMLTLGRGHAVEKKALPSTA